MFRFLDRGGADQDRLGAGGRGLDLADDALVLLFGGPVDLVVLVDAGHGPVRRDLDHFEIVDLEELVGLGRRRAGHAGELVVEPEIVLEGDRGQRLVLGLDLHVLLRLERLVEPFRVAPARHHAAGELVDDHHFAVADDVILVALEQSMGPKRLVHMVDEGRIVSVVEVALLQEAHLAQKLLHLLGAVLGQGHGPLLLVEVVIALGEARNDLVDRKVEIRTVVERARDDEGRARLVDQDRIQQYVTNQ